MVFSYNQCISCSRTWESEDKRSSEWHRVRGDTYERWLCYRCTNRVWKKKAQPKIECPKNIVEALQVLEFKSDVWALLEQHRKTWGTQLWRSETSGNRAALAPRPSPTDRSHAPGSSRRSRRGTPPRSRCSTTAMENIASGTLRPKLPW